MSGALSALQHPASVETIAAVSPATPEAARVFELNRRLARHVRTATADGPFRSSWQATATVA
ncbi:MAG: hypothetical protein ACR2M2_01675 [Gaiellaceae bacterium]